MELGHSMKDMPADRPLSVYASHQARPHRKLMHTPYTRVLQRAGHLAYAVLSPSSVHRARPEGTPPPPIITQPHLCSGSAIMGRTPDHAVR
jgi:hypothetical protein